MVDVEAQEVEVLDEAAVERVKQRQNALQDLVSEATSVEVVNAGSYEYAGELLHQLKQVNRVLEDILEPFRSEAYDYYVRVREMKSEALEPGEEAMDHLKGEMAGYKAELELESAQEREEFARQLEAGEADLEDEPESENVPDLDGVHYRDNWSGEFERKDEKGCLRDLCVAILDPKKPQATTDLIKLDKRAANKLARELGHEMDVSGLEAVNDPVLVDRR